MNIVLVHQDQSANSPIPATALQKPQAIAPTAHKPSGENEQTHPVFVHPKLEWVKEIDLDSLEDHDGSGYVELELLIDVDGHAAKVTRSKTNLPPMFTDLVVATFMEARFTPGTLNGTPISATFRIRINFR